MAKRDNCKCKKCGYGWRSRLKVRTGRNPKQCPYCKSYHWGEKRIYGRKR